MDTAFDWCISMPKHFILKPANVLLTPMKGNSNYYLYGKRSEIGVCMYDKKLQLMERKGESITESNLIRLELRIKPKLKNQRILDDDLSWLKCHFDKIVFVPDVSSVSRSLERDTDKQAFRKIRRRQRQDWAGIDRQTRKRIRAAVRSHAVDLFEMFLCNNLQRDVFWHTG
ncbi:hypothetical protein [Brevibacillus laterosporus]|uniref:hypothetical protein n=1 Tax=Brevibacillus laterosporus TaxID=1465 RepID=UPI0011122176|nr:hypothetical protein [Brevibacillus laterosporus]